MSEFSGFHTTESSSPVGDQVSGYTQAHWKTASQILAACLGFEGVAPNYLNALAGTVTRANTVSINTGGALVDGKWYNNGAAASVTIPSAVGEGNTRIDRIVLRCDWSAFTVRIYRIAGTDAATPSAPSITQTPGTTYDIELYQALVNTSGTVTLTDERVLAQVKATGIAANAVVSGDIASGAVSFANLAAAALVTNRQGGSATDWNSDGTNNYTPPATRIQAGATLSTGGSGAVSVTFPVAFSYKPLVFVSCDDDSFVTVSVISISATAFSGVAINHTTGSPYHGYAANKLVHWLAIGPV